MLNQVALSACKAYHTHIILATKLTGAVPLRTGAMPPLSSGCTLFAEQAALYGGMLEALADDLGT